MATAAHVTGTIELGTLPTDVFVKPVHVLTTANPQVVIWPCERCWDEEGRIAMWSHVAGGVCFKCNGAGGVEMSLAEAEVKAAKLIKSRTTTARANERKRLAKLAARAAKQAALVAEHPGLAVLLDREASGYVRPVQPGEQPDTYMHGENWEQIEAVNVRPLGDTVAAIAEDFQCNPEKFGPGRIAAVLRLIEQTTERLAAKAAAVAVATLPEPGKFEVTGQVVAVWETEVQAGPYSTTWVVKMRVQTPAGWVGIGTAPRALLDAVDGWKALRGKTVAFTATVKPAAEQKTGELPVCWFSKPFRARLV
jgi:hypothetical protein